MKQEYKRYSKIKTRRFIKECTCLVMMILGVGTVKLYAQEVVNKSVDVDYQSVINSKAPLSQTANPAGIYFSPIDSFVHLSLGYDVQWGEYKSVYSGDNRQDLSFETSSYQRIGRTMVFGSFFYNNEKEKGRQYCNTYSATPGTPYMYTDTIGNDIFSREEFGLTGALSYSLSSKLLIGGEVSYQAGLGAQDRDPRAENKVSLTGVKMGALYEMNSWLKVGGSIYYNYYNEDIDIDVVEENSTYFLFNLTGLGTYSKHESSSFYRLYERTSIGEEVQVELKNHLLTVGYQQFYEDVYDGRKESGASWSAVKHDSEYRNETMNIAYVYTLSRNQTVHQLRLDASHKNYVGAEILQELRQIDEQYSVYQWKTLSKEDKYKREDTHLGFKYEFTQFNTDLQRRYWLGMDMVYYKHSENYYIPDLSVSYSNLSAHARCGRYFGFKKSGINLSFSYGRVKNIEREIALPFQTFISDLMIVPDYNYYSSEAEELGARLVYDFKLSDENKVYIRFDYKNLHHLNHSVKRTQFNITLGTVL